MALDKTLTKHSATPHTQSKADMRLQGPWLIIGRAIWISLVALTLGLFVIGLPSYYQQLQTACHDATTCAIYGALNAKGLQALPSFGFSINAYAAYNTALLVFITLVWCLVGFIIFWHRSDDWMALLVAFGLTAFNPTYPGGPSYVLAMIHPTLYIPNTLVASLGQLSISFFFYLFPNGRFVPRWISWFAILPLIAVITQVVLAANSPFNASNWPTWLIFLEGFILVTTILFSQFYRYIRISTPVQRQQTRWVVFGIIVLMVGYLGLSIIFGIFFPQFLQPSTPYLVLPNTAWPLVNLSIPVCIGIATLRYRLYDIDVLINRTLVYGSLTMCIVGMYALIVGGFGALLQAQGNFLISLLAAGLVAILFHPLREQLQRGVNRLFYGQRDEPYTVISQLGSRLEATLAPERVLPTIVETIAAALKLPYTALALPHESDWIVAASTGTPTEDLLRLPLRYQTEQVGQLLLAPRAPGETLSSADQRLVEDLARQAGIAVHAVRLTTDLQRLAADLQRSRTQLVTAREEERRRLRRDLHDGLGSVLTSLNFRAGAIRALLLRDPTTAERLLEEQQTTIRAAIADIRRLVYDLRPPSLDELGLLGAIHERAAHYNAPTGSLIERERLPSLKVTIESPEDLPPLPAAIEVATYRIVQEALANVVRHAQARICCVQLTISNGMLQVEITDDGVGLVPEPRAGVGLLSMRERAAELGGTCQVQPAPGGGTQVLARLPFSAK